MTRAEFILGLLREKPRTFEELLSLTGVSKTIIRTTLSDLARNGYMEAVPKTYRATAKDDGGKPMIDWQAQKTRSASKPRKASPGLVANAIKANEGSALFNLGRN
jgi:predicted ArsR family transcriptional regulator